MLILNGNRTVVHFNFAEGGIPPNNKLKVRTTEGILIKMQAMGLATMKETRCPE